MTPQQIEDIKKMTPSEFYVKYWKIRDDNSNILPPIILSNFQKEWLDNYGYNDSETVDYLSAYLNIDTSIATNYFILKQSIRSADINKYHRYPKSFEESQEMQKFVDDVRRIYRSKHYYIKS